MNRMSTHLLAMIAAVILTEWLLVAGWMREDIQYYFWSAIVIVFWWLGNLRNNPAWPSPRDYHIRLLIFMGFFGITVLFSLMIRSWYAYLVAVTIPFLFALEILIKVRRRR